MTYEQIQWQQELLELFPNSYDPSYVPIWHTSWCDYEENGWIFVLEKGTQMYVQQGGHSVMADQHDNTPCWAPYTVTYDQLCEILSDWEEYLD